MLLGTCALLITLGTSVLHSPAPADKSQWVGTWKLDRSASHFVGFAVTITRLPHSYRFELEGKTIEVGDDGKDYATVPTRTTSFTQINEHQWFRTHKINGNEVDHSTFTLAPDDQSFVIHTTAFDDAGKKHESDETFLREGPGKAIDGTWRSTSAGVNVSDVFTVSSTPDGRLLFSYPQENLFYTTSLDGSPAAYGGAHAIPGLRITATADSSTRLHWVTLLDGKPYIEGTDMLSPDGKVLIETSWHVGRPGDKDEAVYRRL